MRLLTPRNREKKEFGYPFVAAPFRSLERITFEVTPGFGYMVFGYMVFLALFLLYGKWSIRF